MNDIPVWVVRDPEGMMLSVRYVRRLAIEEGMKRAFVCTGIDYSWEQCLFDFHLSLPACTFPPVMMWENKEALGYAIKTCKAWNSQVLVA